MSSRRLQRRLDSLQAAWDSEQRRVPINWSSLSDAELDRLEGLAIQAETYADEGTFLGSLSPDDREWLDAIAERLGITVAVSGTMT
jgi:hypothetical protein